MKTFAALLIALVPAARAFAQEGITQPLPKSEVQKGQATVEGDLILGYNTELDIALYGASGQLLYGLTDDVGLNGKLTLLVGDNFSVFTFGGALSIEILHPTAPLTPVFSVFGGFGLSVVHVDIGTDDFTDTDGYLEFGGQADLYVGPNLRIIPFVGFTVVFGGGSDVIFGLGGKAQYEISPTWHINVGIIGQFGDISDAVLFMFGIVKEFK